MTVFRWVPQNKEIILKITNKWIYEQEAALRDLDGNDVTLHAILAERPTVLIFCRCSWCPYCNLHFVLATEAALQPAD